MRMEFCTIASGSSGNCTYIGTDYTKILIDAGISGKKIEEGLANLKLTGDKIDALFITHEHVDHIKGAGILSRRFDILFLLRRIPGRRWRKALGGLRRATSGLCMRMRSAR